jgi:hypothetical protein
VPVRQKKECIYMLQYANLFLHTTHTHTLRGMYLVQSHCNLRPSSCTCAFSSTLHIRQGRQHIRRKKAQKHVLRVVHARKHAFSAPHLKMCIWRSLHATMSSAPLCVTAMSCTRYDRFQRCSSVPEHTHKSAWRTL